jgi:hypothetical protein
MNGSFLSTSIIAISSIGVSGNSALATEPCPGNINGIGTSQFAIDVDDLLMVIDNWGPCPAPPQPCPANIVSAGSSTGRVDVDDLLLVISAWGPCPS